ncbi:MAG: tetratricopeptide repeat protein [Candidatus Poribacteria bacterium]|nr:tetratricopeptide repeat protein [Candidatus Poribacteria bacterium]MDE0467247.1 tetratricopeptide repeat protein [Candidatus Poribacteria bacterium]
MKDKNNLFYNQSPRPMQYLPLIAALLLCLTTVAPAQTTEQIAEKALAATVSLEMKDRNGTILGFGSGFFVRENLIATNFHVIEGAASGTAKLVGKYRKYNIEGTTATDEKNDLALLKVNANGMKPLSLGDSNYVKIGATIYVAGNPKGLEGTFSDGIISSRRERHAKERLQMTAPISPGSSGGPVLNRKGEVIGVSFMTLEGGQNLNFAIPSNYLKKLLNQSRHPEPLSQRKQPISAETHFVRGNTEYHLGNYHGAMAYYTLAILSKSDFVKAYYNRAVVKVILGQYRSAVDDYNKIIQLIPDDADVYYNRGNARHYLGQYYDAIADYNKAIHLKPDYASAYHGRGFAKRILGQYYGAITDYDKAIQLKPDFAEAYYFRGSAKAELNQYFAAISDYTLAIHLKSDYALASYERGSIRTTLDQYRAAIADFDKAVQLKPDLRYAYALRGTSKGILGRTWEAKQDLLIALRLAKQVGDKGLKTKIERILRDLY